MRSGQEKHHGAWHCVWASGRGGQRIGWNYNNDRMVVVFSSTEAWMPEVYELARDSGQAQR